ncbi:hypothetical protein OH76DRAFT_1490971 [Lentinus brumalis]|uniref:Uncharacterized protein n=1 Tax=Lentinus brumalis TaxID=2498619 RepID=A0A371CH70_9APHY|nr:hypothetical protein OH76DRAFT_1490971 [Polyporus brumalis]
MSNPANLPTQNKAPAFPPGLFTEDGGLILVAATPPLYLRGDVAGQASTLPPLTEGSPLVINDTYELDSPTPLAAAHDLPAPPLTQRGRARGLADDSAEYGVDGDADAALRRALESGTREGHGGSFFRVEAAARSSMSSSLPSSSLDLSISQWNDGQERAGRASSSPVDLEWSSSVSSTLDLESPTPTARAIQRRGRTATDALGLDFGSNPANHPQPAPDRELDALNANGERESDVSTDYFGFFSSPPHDLDPLLYQNPPPANAPRHDDEGRPIMPETRSGGAEERSRLNQPALNGDPRAAYHGEPPRTPDAVDHGRNPRKRLWLGSPDPEDLQRALRRPRPSNTTPIVEDGRLLADGDHHGRNPWQSEERGRASRTTFLRTELDLVFDPVTASTPTHLVRSMVDLSLASGHPSSADARPSQAGSDASRIRDSGRDLPPHLSRTSDYAAVPTPPAQQPRDAYAMDVEDPDTCAVLQQEEPKRDKGKGRARALSQVPEDPATEQRACSPPAENAWCEAELHEARQRSLRDSDHRRAGGRTRPYSPHESQTRGAGPSGVRQDTEHVEPWSERSWSRREDYASRTQPGLHDYGSRYSREHLASGPNRIPAFPRERDDSRRRSRLGREPSAFVPLPNTRAARYVADNPTAPPPRQRSPLSRVTNLQQPYPQTYLASPSAARTTRAALDDENIPPIPAFGARARRPSSGSSDEDRLFDDHSHDQDGWPQEEGELLPSALCGDDAARPFEPTEVPDGGFPAIHRDDPEAGIRGMATDWVREMWSDPPHSVVFVDVFNYRYTEDDAYNRRIADNIRRGIEYIAEESDFDVVPPEPEEGARTHLVIPNDIFPHLSPLDDHANMAHDA